MWSGGRPSIGSAMRDSPDRMAIIAVVAPRIWPSTSSQIPASGHGGDNGAAAPSAVSMRERRGLVRTIGAPAVRTRSSAQQRS